jgi:hypothetical protein
MASPGAYNLIREFAGNKADVLTPTIYVVCRLSGSLLDIYDHKELKYFCNFCVATIQIYTYSVTILTITYGAIVVNI